MPLNQKTLDAAFAVLERAAISGERCPTRDAGMGPELTTPLARAGRIKVEISGRNWRTVTILTGPHAGKRTKPDPKNSHVYQTISLTSEWTPKPSSRISRTDRIRREGRQERRASRNLYRSNFQPT